MNDRPKILVVDDEQVVLDSARRILTAEGHAVLTATDAERALEMLQMEEPGIVISDLMLPGISGIEFLEAVEARKQDLVVIITTGYSTVDNAVACLKKGAFDFLPKPFTFDELLGQVHRAGRFLALPPAARRQMLPASAPSCRYLGLQTWARVDKDGTGLLGVTVLFLQTVDRIESIEFPDPNARLMQGGRLVRLTTADELVHEVWSPLSGQVLMINDQLRENPDLPHQDPVAGWLLRVAPTSLDGELPNLNSP